MVSFQAVLIGVCGSCFVWILGMMFTTLPWKPVYSIHPRTYYRMAYPAMKMPVMCHCLNFYGPPQLQTLRHVCMSAPCAPKIEEKKGGTTLFFFFFPTSDFRAHFSVSHLFNHTHPPLMKK